MKLNPAIRELFRIHERESLEDDAIYPQVAAFWSSLENGSSAYWTPRLLDRVWVANRCMQLCCQQIASMPLRHFGGAREPAWVANPDPAWFPNGIGDAVFAAHWNELGYGDAYLMITSRYADGFPSAWTVLDSATMHVENSRGRRIYRSGDKWLDPDDVVQISRNPRGGLKGTSALAAYAELTWGIAEASALGRSLGGANGSIPNAVLKMKRRLPEGNAQKLQEDWMAARARAAIGAPAVLPPEVDFEQLQFSPEDLMLLELQQFDARAIASAFSVPAFMLNMPLEGGLTYQNPETLFEVWWRTELRPTAGRMQRALSANMLPRGQWVEFEPRAVLAPTFKDQVSSWLELVKEGIVTPDEMRAAVLHLPSLTLGEAIDDLAEPPTAAATPAQADALPAANVQELRPAVMA